MASQTHSTSFAVGVAGASAGTGGTNANDKDGMSNASEVAFIRLTLMGMSGSGKSSLASVFVNNVFYSAYQQTSEPELYYTTIRISSKDDRSDFTVLLEIEDTFGSDVGVTANGDNEIKVFYDLWYPGNARSKNEEEMATKDVTDDTGQVRSTRHPFSMCKAPTEVDENAKQKYAPLTRNRMAYLIVFDVNDRASLQEAMKLHTELTQRLEGSVLRPVVHLIANKIDKDPWGTECEVVRGSAKEYSMIKGVPFNEVSALQFRKVKKVFRNILQEVLVRPNLWMTPTFPGLQKDDSNAAKCVVQ